VFLRNGARLYLDVGSHPEYATAECDNLAQLVTHDRAGERVLEELLIDAEQRLAEEGIGGDIYLFKNNTDSAGNSYGCHENFLVVRAGEFSRISDVLLPFLVTRQLICGAGKILQTPKAATFCLSQRAEHIWEGVSSATTRSRPIINTRDEPHADAEKYRRLHVIVGDSNMSETSTMLKVGTASLVLEMIEAGVSFRDFALDNPIRAIREVSHDLTGKRPVRLAGGRQASALDIQREYHARAVEHLRNRDRDPHVDQVVELWGRTLDAVEAQDFAKVDTEIDWVIKRKLFQRYQDRYGMELSDPKIAQLDLAYHDIKRGRGVFDLLQRKGLAKRVTEDEAVDAAVDTPPQTTRAKLRGDFITAAQEAGRDFTVDWVHLKLNDQAQRTVLCKDPFRSVDERVDRLIASM
jgi:proteasome accessory factor A